MTTAIRAAGPHHLLFPEPYVLFNFGSAPTNISLPGGDANSGMSWHMYTLDVAKEPSVIAFADAWSAQTGGALLNTEFGAVTDPPTIDRMVGELDDALAAVDLVVVRERDRTKDLHQPPTEDNLDQPAATRHRAPAPGGRRRARPPCCTTTPAPRRSRSRARPPAPAAGRLPCGTVTSLQVPAAPTRTATT